MQVKERMTPQPRLHARVLVRGVVVHDQRGFHPCGVWPGDSLQTSDEFLVSVLWLQSPMTTPSSTLHLGNGVQQNEVGATGSEQGIGLVGRGEVAGCA